MDDLPGSDLIARGLADLERGIESDASLLVSIGAGNLRRAGLDVPESHFTRPEHRLYLLLAEDSAVSAHSRYNALIRRLVSFERALGCVG